MVTLLNELQGSHPLVKTDNVKRVARTNGLEMQNGYVVRGRVF